MDLGTEYRLGEMIASRNGTALFRGTRIQGGQAVLVRRLAGQDHHAEDLARFSHEFEFASRLPLPEILKPLQLLRDGRGHALVLEDFPGRPGMHAFQDRPPDASAFLRVAVAVARSLSRLHGAGAILGAIHPASILVHGEKPVSVKWTDLGHASLGTALAGFPMGLDTGVPRDLLPYLSPEQTGSTGKLAGFPSDLYSLGAIFFEWLTGHPPFGNSPDPAEAIHRHLAFEPMLPEAVRGAALPKALSGILSRLLMKSPEDRYPSSAALADDLAACLEHRTRFGSLEGLPAACGLGRRPAWPQRLTGREQERKSLRSAFERARHGAVEFVLVTGPSGVGKTALVRELREAAQEAGGFFVSGKFRQYVGEAPHAALSQALGQAIGQILAGGGDELEYFKARFREAVGNPAGPLLGLLPDFERIIGPQPPAPDCGPTESQNRFKRALSGFFKALADGDHPLVLFLDDLQWADSDSWLLIRHLTSDPELRCLLIIGACRSGEDAPAHPAEPGNRESVPEGPRMEISPWTPGELEDFLSDLLECPRAECASLGALIYGKTRGNPFFTIEFLKLLFSREMLVPANRAASGCSWAWDLERLRSLPITENVVGFLIERIQVLGPGPRLILKAAACLGGGFAAETLASVTGVPMETLLPSLREAQDEELLVPCPDDSGKLAFQHDRIQQAAYQLIPGPDRAGIHLAIGRHLLDRWAGDDKGLYELANHFNEAAALLSDPSERRRVAELDFSAGAKAKAAFAYEMALKHFKAGIGLLEDGEAWNIDYSLAFRLHLQAAECEYLAMDYASSEARFRHILGHAANALDKAAVFNIWTMVREHLIDHASAIRIGLEGLRILGIRLPERPNRVHLLAKLIQVGPGLAKKDFDADEALLPPPPASEKIAMQLLFHLWNAAFLSGNDNLQGMVVLTMIQSSLRHGSAEASPVAWACYGAFQSSQLGNVRSGLRIGDYAVRMAERFGNGFFKGRTRFIYAALLSYHRMPLKETLAYLRRTFEVCCEAGDLLFAGYCNDLIAYIQMAHGFPLREVEAELKGLEAFARKAGHRSTLESILVLRRWNSGLCAPRDGDGNAMDGEFRFAETLTDKMEKGFFYLSEWHLALLYRRFDVAEGIQARLEGNPIIDPSSFFSATRHFYASLTAAALLPGAASRARGGHRRALKAGLRALERAAGNCPENFLHAYLLARAERNRLARDWEEASQDYDQAIAAAAAGGFLHDEALANELAADFHLARGREKQGRSYLRDAHHAYCRWGALAKARDLERKYPRAMPLGHPGAEFPAPANGESGRLYIAGMDFAAFMKASNAILGEIVLPKLLGKLMKIMSEVAGAQKGVLILEREGRLLIQAEWHADGGGVECLKSLPVESSDMVSSGVVNYVARTERMIILPDETLGENFARDPYLSSRRPRSVLCLPLIHQGKLAGILYMENQLHPGSFTPDRREILALLSSQAAISLGNARNHALQLEALQSKINPHFLYNALNSIAQLVVSDPGNAEDGIVKLAHLCRYILTCSVGKLVPLEQELDFVRKYLAVEKLRIGARLEYAVTTSGDVGRVRLPGLLIQPLAENSIHHGILPKLGAGKVDVHAEILGSTCRIVVEDDGEGAKKPTYGTGFGLKSIQERLGLVYGDAYTLGISEDKGYRVEINIPILEAQ